MKTVYRMASKNYLDALFFVLFLLVFVCLFVCLFVFTLQKGAIISNVYRWIQFPQERIALCPLLVSFDHKSYYKQTQFGLFI